LAGSRRDLDGNPAGIAARFWPPGFFLSAGIPAESRQDSRREAKFRAAKISPRSCWESRHDSRQEAKISAAKISPGSCRESRGDSHREAEIPEANPTANLVEILAGKELLGGQNLAGMHFRESRQYPWRPK